MAKLYITNEAKYEPPRSTYLARLVKPCGPSFSMPSKIPNDNDMSFVIRNDFYVEVEGEDQVEIGNQVFYKNSGDIVNNKNIEIDTINTGLVEYHSRAVYRTDSDGFINRITRCDKNGNIYYNNG